METLNDKLINVSELQSAIKEDSKLCETLLLNGINNMEDENIIAELIEVVLKNMETLKTEQYKILELNFKNTIIYEGKAYTVLELIKLKERYKLQMDFINNIINIVDKKVDNNSLTHLLNYQIQLTKLRKQNFEIQKLITNHNMKLKDINETR